MRKAAPFGGLTRPVLEAVLDMLAGRYPSEDFAGLRPRIVWDRVAGIIRARPGAQRLAVTSGGTIPDRGLFGVFLASEARVSSSSGRQPRRVGELDEEMVYESRVGDVFVLGRQFVADRGHHPGPGAGHARARAAGAAAVLARRHPGPARRAGPGHRGGLPFAGLGL